VPLVLRHPDSLTGERIFADVVGLEDVAPTLLDWFGLPPLPGARGRSLLAVTDAYVERPFPERPAFAQLPERALYTARDARWRLVWNPLRAQPAGRPVSAGPLPELVLHDLEADPAGRRDVAAAEPEVVARLQAQIRAWREAQTVIEPADPRPIRPAALQR
jgi:arylsulfatase A-like enzyme